MSNTVQATIDPRQVRRGDWIQTHSGIQFWPLDPRAPEIDIKDVAHSLSLQCRFGGHTNTFYSVAEHSVRVSRAVPPEHALWGLLHDAAEAYLVDLPRPIKRFSEMGALYREIEEHLMTCVCIRFGLDLTEPPAVKVADVALLMTEKRDLMKMEPKPWEDTSEPLPDRIEPWDWKIAKWEFLQRFTDLTGDSQRA